MDAKRTVLSVAILSLLTIGVAAAQTITVARSALPDAAVWTSPIGTPIDDEILLLPDVEAWQRQPFLLAPSTYTIDGQKVDRAVIFGRNYFPSADGPVLVWTEEMNPVPPEEFLDVGRVITNVLCDEETRALRFTITNTGEKIWDFDQGAATPVDAPVRVFVNGYEATKPFPYFDPMGDGYLFGDGDANFVEQCTGDRYLAPGETMDCTLQPVPLIPEGALYGNAIWLDVPEANDPVHFTCT